ncbi:MAG TPA: response regulator [Rhodocyclaceae bacterium]|jgi:twitching motility two-component system response regulator PilH|nr:response regulator [Rhodocyclaceae bacterium]HMV22050.1 response regulator [Rhodocyclaceae bacterium]HNE42399.1 response regulator [Rhodocyclaceae bacterium]HNL21437.1 response regulator [Rhodocyclaceae bacterium]HNM82448.1 response regulator [Rhodocyclaceae bacterium]
MGILNQIRAAFARAAEAKTPEPVEQAVPPCPPVAPEPAATTNSERRSRQRVNARKGTRALIVDDSPTVVAVLRKNLRSVGFVTHEALNGETALEIARRDRPELVFLDIVLPGMSGFAVLRTLRRDPLTRDIPVIMMSGNEQATEQFYADRIGADDFMKKPFSRFEIFSRIEHLLDPDLAPARKRTADSAPETVRP